MKENDIDQIKLMASNAEAEKKKAKAAKTASLNAAKKQTAVSKSPAKNK